MFCNNCGNRLIQGAHFCDNCGTVIGQAPGQKPRSLSALGLTGVITASIVLISCIASWFLFFAGPPVDAGTDKTTERSTKITTTETRSVSETSENPDSSTTESIRSTESIVETTEHTTVVPTETTETGPIEPSAYEATVKPAFEDFVWYTSDVYVNGSPDQAIRLDFSQLQGNWKALFWYDPQNAMDAEGWDSLLLGISGSPEEVRLKLDWQDSYIKSIDSIVDVSTIADSEMTGIYDIEGIVAGDPGYELYLIDFYLLGDYQYAFGYMLVASGEEVSVALVRP